MPVAQKLPNFVLAFEIPRVPEISPLPIWNHSIRPLHFPFFSVILLVLPRVLLLLLPLLVLAIR